MEEDIKILEKYINEKEGALKIWQIETINECEDLRVAIENLIAGYKELEEYKKDAELTKIVCCVAQNCEALNNCIRLERENAELKSKLQELLED